jgi:hypothetical protein
VWQANFLFYMAFHIQKRKLTCRTCIMNPDMILSKADQNMTTQFCRTLRRKFENSKKEVFQFLFSAIQWVKMNYQTIFTDHSLLLLFFSPWYSNYEYWEYPSLESQEYGHRDPSR